YERFAGRETILVSFRGHPECGGRSRFCLRYFARRIASEVGLLKCDKSAAAIDDGENMVPAILLAFRLTGGNRRSWLLERNRRAIGGRRRWWRRRLLLSMNRCPEQ